MRTALALDLSRHASAVLVPDTAEVGPDERPLDGNDIVDDDDDDWAPDDGVDVSPEAVIARSRASTRAALVEFPVPEQDDNADKGYKPYPRPAFLGTSSGTVHLLTGRALSAIVSSVQGTPRSCPQRCDGER